MTHSCNLDYKNDNVYSLMKQAIKKGCCICMTTIHKTHYVPKSRNYATFASYHGQLECFKFLEKKKYCIDPNRCLIAAIKHGHSHIVTYLFDNYNYLLDWTDKHETLVFEYKTFECLKSAIMSIWSCGLEYHIDSNWNTYAYLFKELLDDEWWKRFLTYQSKVNKNLHYKKRRNLTQFPYLKAIVEQHEKQTINKISSSLDHKLPNDLIKLIYLY